MSKRIDISKIDSKVSEMITNLRKRHEKRAAKLFKKWPMKFLSRAQKFYPSVLKRPTGRLIRSFTPVTRRIGDNVVVMGLRAGSDSDTIEYARPLHDGFRGVVNVPTHSVRSHSRRMPTGTVTVKEHTRRAHTMNMNIRARKFFETPMRAILPELLKDFKTMDSWKD